MKAYFDTGIFLYLVNPSSIHHMECKELLKFCQEKGIEIVASVQTVQEIITYSKNTKQLEWGLDIAQFILSAADQVIAFDEAVMKHFLKNSANYLSPSSRDLIHLSFCQATQIKVMVTYDQELSRFKDLKVLTPSKFIHQNS